MNDTTNINFLCELEAVIAERRTASTENSYTARLLAAGHARIAQKVGEEGVELAIAGVQGRPDEIVEEAADLIYHLLVMLESHGLSLADVVRALEARRY